MTVSGTEMDEPTATGLRLGNTWRQKTKQPRILPPKQAVRVRHQLGGIETQLQGLTSPEMGIQLTSKINRIGIGDICAVSDNKVDVLGEGVYDFSTVTCVCDDELKSFAARAPALYELHKVLRCKILSKQRQTTSVSMTGEMQDCRRW